MGGKSRVTSGLLLDANVIIDFQMAGSLDLFIKIGRCSGPLWVVDRTLDEVNGPPSRNGKYRTPSVMTRS